MSEVFQGFSGQAFSLRSEKGRFTLPPAFRNAVKLSTVDRKLCLTKHDKWDCLVGFGMNRVEDFETILDREEEAAYKFGHAAEPPVDERFLLLDSYHCSRYNTQTRRLTPAMFAAVFERARALLDGTAS